MGIMLGSFDETSTMSVYEFNQPLFAQIPFQLRLCFGIEGMEKITIIQPELMEWIMFIGATSNRFNVEGTFEVNRVTRIGHTEK